MDSVVPDSRCSRGSKEDVDLDGETTQTHGAWNRSPTAPKAPKQTEGFHLWPRSPILDLAGVETLLLRVLHAGEDPRAAEAHRVDGALVMEQHSVRDDLGSSQTNESEGPSSSSEGGCESGPTSPRL